MGRSLKKRKLKKTKRVKVARATPAPEKKDKKKMKAWEWWLIGGAILFAFIWLIIIAQKGVLTPDVEEATPTPATQQEAVAE